jgi:hypothetical protein
MLSPLPPLATLRTIVSRHMISLRVDEYALLRCTRLRASIDCRGTRGALQAVAFPKGRVSFSQASVVGCAHLQVIQRRSP